MQAKDVSPGAQLSKVCSLVNDCLRTLILEALQVTGLPPAEEDIMTRLNNTLTMQTSTSYEQIPSFHSEVRCND